MFLSDVDPVTVQIRDLSISVDTAPSWFEPATYPELLRANFSTAAQVKTLLYSVSADFKPGTLTAIIGSSGSGKTTLLNSMAERVTSSRLRQEGLILFNGYSIRSIKHAYVVQQDILIPTLTVRETLRYSAALRLPPGTSHDDQHRIVEDVIQELGLKECAETRIGNSQHGGCSGGEQRRVSIGVQLLANPSVLFLDEPTTGLDATSAFQLVSTLKMLAQKGRTIITTIHQPRSEIWNLFDDLIVLSRGSPIYSGPAVECVPWFNNQGLQLPQFVNPAEFIIDISAIDDRTPEREKVTKTRVDTLKETWRLKNQDYYAPLKKAVDNGTHKLATAGMHRPSFSRQIRVLTDRTARVTYRDPLGMTAAILGAIIMGITSGCIYYDLARDQAGIRSRQGGLFLAAGMQGYLTLIFEVYRITIDIPIFDRESAEGCADPLPFILSRRLARMFIEDIPVPLLFSVIFYFMAGYDNEAKKFFVFFAITIVNHYVAVSCAMTCVAASRHFASASLIANLASTLQSLGSGMLVQTNTIPVYIQWTKWITYTFYAFGAYTVNEFQGSFYDCPYPNGSSKGECIQYAGEYIIKALGFPENWIWRPIVALMSFVFFFVFLSTIGLRYFKVRVVVARAHVSNRDLSTGKEELVARSSSEIRTIEVKLENFALALNKRAVTGKWLPTKTILDPISTTFHSGMLNVVMGPSGSGKSSLLAAIALRLRNSISTEYRPSGKLTFNGNVPSELVVQSVCSYVCQHDDALLPSLTVRETLRFAACLRLPPFMSTEEKHQRAEEILVKMGLKDCADNLIGNAWIKGASGGEKRRVSIAIQILTNPRILLLDEPTSGLDAFTAKSIIEVLHGLANEGRTLILTVHQARSDIFEHFGDVLLLARGGQPVYSGPGKEMLEYFETHGCLCPLNTNPADFALDLITIDLQHNDREKTTRLRVQRLIEAWKDQVKNTGTGVERSLGDIEKARKLDEGYSEARKNHEKKLCDENGTIKTDQKPQHCHSEQDSAAMGQCKLVGEVSLSSPAQLGALVRQRASFAGSLPILIRRAIINTYRQPQLILARTMQVIGLSLMFTLFFAPIHNDYYAVQNRMGILQEVGALYFVGMLQNIAVYPNERDTFYQEDDDGVYGVEAFLTTYTLLEVPFEILSSMVFGLLCIMAVGLPHTTTMYFVCVLSCFSVVSCGESLGIIFNTLSDHMGFSVNMVGVCLALANCMTGVLSIDIPQPFKSINYLSPLRYTTRVLAFYSLRDIKFGCSDDQRLSGGRCPIETGEEVIKLYKLDGRPVVGMAALAVCVILYRVLAWGLLRGKRTRWGHTIRRTS
ncbi:ABC transporter protein [Rutstroemia sp. NJR-2017a BVV2]|nr:ABC transporter protein [Rutstroemia sp. NJR-2017a BVV2]